MKDTPKNILIVEDEFIVAKGIQSILASNGYKVGSNCFSGEQALSEIENWRPDLILMDISLQGELNGIETAEIIKEKYKLPVIFLTAYSGHDFLSKAKQTDPYGYIVKPFKETDLLSNIEITLNRLCQEQKIQEELQHAKAEKIALANTIDISKKRILDYTNRLREEKFEQCRIEHSLKTTEKEYRNLFENAHDAIIIFSKETGAIIEVNNRACEIYGFHKEGFLQKGYYTLSVNPNEVTFLNSALELNGGKNSFSTSHITAHGKPITFSVNASFVTFKGIQSIMCINRDISEQINAQRKIINNREKYNHTLQSLPQPLFEADEDGKLIYVNNATLKTFGYSIQDFNRGILVKDLLSSGQDNKYENVVASVVSGKNLHGIEFSCIKKNGQNIQVVAYVSPIYKENVIVGTRGFLVDITQDKEKEIKIKNLHAALEQSADSVFITNRAGEIEYVNKSFTEITGYTESEALGKRGNLLKSGKHKPNFYKKLWKCLDEGNPFKGEFINRKKNGQFYWVRQTITPIKNETGEITHFISCGTDITEEKQARQKLELLQRQKNRQKEHESKISSISIIKGQEEERKRLSREIHDGLGQMLYGILLQIENFKVSEGFFNSNENINSITKYLREILGEVRRISSDLMPTELNDFGIFPAIIKVVNQLKAASSINFHISLPENFGRLEPIIEVTIFRILQEAINNAMKYANATNISVKYSEVNNKFTITVKDDGVGFNPICPKEYLGSGKGLGNMKERANLIGGALFVFSKPNIGTSIIFEHNKKLLKWKKR
jgi:two-component system, NarL family, sensor histidine kinase NreB